MVHQIKAMLCLSWDKRCEMKLIVSFQTSTVQPLTFGNESVISFHALQWISHLMTQRAVTNKHISALINIGWLLHQAFWCWNRDILGGLGQYQGTSNLRLYRAGKLLYTKNHTHARAMGRIECPYLWISLEVWRYFIHYSLCSILQFSLYRGINSHVIAIESTLTM